MSDTVAAPRPLPMRETIALFGVLFATIAFSIDAMLPALPAIGAELSPENANRAQLIVTSFVLGMGFGTFFAGPLSDAFGRKPVIVAGLALYAAAALWGAFEPDLIALLVARFVQGFGAAAPRVVTVAMVRDMYAGRDMARVMSFIMMVFILIPAVAPSIGAVLIWGFGWRSIFLAFTAFGLVSATWFILRQPETLTPAARRPLKWAALRGALAEVLGTRATVTYIAALTLAFGQMFAILSSAPQIFDEVFDRSRSFPLWFMLLALLAGFATITNAKLVMTLGMRRLATLAFVAQFAAALIMLPLALTGLLPQPWDFAAFFIYMTMTFFMVGLTFGNLNALAMEPWGHIAGLAASIIGAASTVGAVAIAVPVGLAYDGTIVPLILSATACSGLALMLMRSAPGAPGAPRSAR
jgi:DHA1 family bicyclomycin/chloramphenicol resistance-like MFS transporter